MRGSSGSSSQAGSHGLDANRIGIGGISAGGGLTAATTLLARDRGQVQVAFSLALCAQLDDRHITTSSTSIHDLRVWNTQTSKSAWGAYLRDVGDDVPPYAAPARATDLSGLPPTFLLVGELDPFRDENIEYARRLIESGVPTELHVYPGAYHGFEVLAPDARVSRAALAARDSALERFLLAALEHLGHVTCREVAGGKAAGVGPDYARALSAVRSAAAASSIARCPSSSRLARRCMKPWIMPFASWYATATPARSSRSAYAFP